MQLSGRFGGTSTPPPQGPADAASSLDLAREAMRRRYRRNYLRQMARVWWYRIALIVVAGCIAAALGEFVMIQPKAVAVILVVPLLVFWMVKRLEVGLVALAVLAAPLVPMAFSVKSVDIYPIEPALVLLLATILTQAAFRKRQFVWPSLWAIWPQIGLIALAIISEIMIQVTWIPEVSRRLNATPVLYSELLGVTMYCVPLVIIIVTSACLTGKDHWILNVESAILIMAALCAVVVCVEFKRIGATVYTFRYTESVIFYMRLGALAQYIGLGAMIAYARALAAERWRSRLMYLALASLCLLAVYFTLEKSRLVYTLVGLVVITFAFSRRLFLALCALSLPLIPVALHVVNTIAQGRAINDLYRFIVWQDMLRVWSKRPLLGVGPGNVWSYDQVFTHLPLLLRNFNKTGLGVAHNGVLQVLTEVGPLGVILYYAFVLTIVIMAVRLYRRSRAPEKRADRVLALICLGLICGSTVADPVAGIFFLPPTQIGGFNDLARVCGTWIMLGCLIYRDQVWRLSLRQAKFTRRRAEDDLAAVAAAQRDVDPAKA